MSKQEAEKIRTEEQIRVTEKDIKNLSAEIKNKFGCEPNSKAIKAEIARLADEIDADFKKLSGIFNNTENEEDDL